MRNDDDYDDGYYYYYDYGDDDDDDGYYYDDDDDVIIIIMITSLQLLGTYRRKLGQKVSLAIDVEICSFYQFLMIHFLEAYSVI